MADVLYTSDLDLAAHQKKGVWRKAIKSGILSQLAAADPEIKVGDTNIFTFLDTARAELVGEGADKSSQNGKPTKSTAKTYKVQVTYRMSDEVKYEDEDYQIGLVESLVGRVGEALSRALDLIAIHGVNPATGAVSGQVTQYLDKAGFLPSEHVITETSNKSANVKAMAAALQGAGYNATAVAFDPSFAGELARSEDSQNRPLYPELGLGFNVENFQGLRAASSDTVSGRSEIDTPLVKSIMGDFRAFVWGVARQVPLRTIEYGDPDGNGDLQRTNEIAIRAEAYLGFAFVDPNAFAIVKATPSS